MKSWSRLCILVLAISSVSRGQTESVSENVTGTVNGTTGPQVISTPAPVTNETQDEAPGPTGASSSPQTNTSSNATEPPQSAVSAPPGAETAAATGEITAPAASSTEPYGGEEVTSPPPVTIEEVGHSSWGYVILVLIILAIIILCVILYFIRRLSNTYSYSFNPHHQAPADHLNEPIGTFELVYLDDLDRPSSKDQATGGDLSLPRVSNGTILPSEDRRSNGENALQGQPDANGTEAPPTSNTSNTSNTGNTSNTSNTSTSLGRDPADDAPSPLSCTNMFFDATGEEQQNENNNNNPSVCSSDPFVEINLDEAALSDQLLTSLEAPSSSSVLPFSPFSFSSSSSSSSSSLHLH